jgi:isopropylmalate/homocitrate/citramalate synthase
MFPRSAHPVAVGNVVTRTAHVSAEIADIAPDTHEDHVGTPVFAHEADPHASAITVDPEPHDRTRGRRHRAAGRSR